MYRSDANKTSDIRDQDFLFQRKMHNDSCTAAVQWSATARAKLRMPKENIEHSYRKFSTQIFIVFFFFFLCK